MTDSDVKEFFDTLDNRNPLTLCRRFLHMYQEYRVLFRLYACCGLRNAEECELKSKNIDLTTGIITIVHSKGDKDRLVYLPDDLRYLCCEYWRWLTRALDFIPEYFFPGKDPKTCIPKTTVCRKFNQIWSMTEASKHCDKKPTVHGFRHYFVCKRINTWTNEGVELHCMMPYLSSYLGHSSPEETYYYYHTVEDSVQVLRSKDTVSASVIPEVTNEEKDYEKLFFSRTRDYLDHYLTSELSRSPETIESYRDALTVFRRFITDEKRVSLMSFTFEDCTSDLVLSFIEHLQKKGISRSTCNHRVAALHSYLWYVSDIDISVLPTAITISHLPFLRVPKAEWEVISRESMSALLSAPDCSRRIGVRDTLIMVILYDTAVRLSELRSLKVSDLNITCDAPYVRIHGKGDKERLVAVSDKTKAHVRRYLELFHGPSSPETDYLIYTVIHGSVNRMSSGNIQRLIKKYADQIRPDYPDLPSHVHPHMFRRSRATALYQSGVPLELISRMLGHASMTTTRIYARPSVEMIRKAMDKSNAMTSMDTRPIWTDAIAGSNEEMARYFGLR